MTGRVDIVWHIFAKTAKKLKLTQDRTQKSRFVESFQINKPKTTFFCSCDFIFNFFAIFSKMRHSISTLPVILSFMKFCVARTFWVERHLDVVLEVLQVGSKFLFYKTCRDLPLEDSLKKLWWLLKKWGRYLTFWTLEKKEKRNIEVSKFFNFGKLKKQKKQQKKRNIEVSKIFNFGNLKI